MAREGGHQSALQFQLFQISHSTGSVLIDYDYEYERKLCTICSKGIYDQLLSQSSNIIGLFNSQKDNAEAQDAKLSDQANTEHRPIEEVAKSWRSIFSSMAYYD